MAMRVREMTTEENEQIARWARSRIEPARVVERARIILAASQGKRVPAIGHQLNLSEKAVRLWLKRFNTQGLAGLTDEPRSGRPATYTAEQISEVIAAALTKPDALGQPFGSWTLDRLEVYLNEEKGLPIKRSRIDEILIEEGLRWRTQEGWFGERAGRDQASATTDPERDTPVDPEFAQKRGRSRPSTRRRRAA
jgi:transposase